MKKIDAVIKTDTAENWAKARNYIPDSGTIIIYVFADGTQGMKKGDGEAFVNDLPFWSTSSSPQVVQDTLELSGDFLFLPMN